jgi:16S rRNA (cytosine1402-N4)-methyltransferase
VTAAATGHVPVLLDPVLKHLGGGERRLLLDCTLGLGGHTEAWLEQDARARAIGLDRDPEMLERARRRLEAHGERVRLVSTSYAEAERVLAGLGETSVDAILLDAGVASPHLDDPDRGFSLDGDGLLDMRFDRSEGRTAEELLRTAPESELARILETYGEERRSRAVAREIVAARRLGPIRTTLHLAEIVRRAAGRSGRIHPATRTFQALRIAVNDELAHLERGLDRLPVLLAPGGRIAVISFHSLEDRLVKRAFRDAENLEVLTRRPLVADDAEIRRNPRSRSAKLRVAGRPEGDR